MLSDRCVHIVEADADADDRERGALLLRAAGYDVEAHASGRAFLDSQPDRKPGCILLDIRVPEPDGLAVQDEMLSMGAVMPVIVFTGDQGLDLAVRAMKAGALHFLEKPYVGDDLLNMVAEAFERLGASEADADRKAVAEARLALLSPRELQVLEGMIEGLPNKLIAHRLGLSIRTVETYRNNLMDKLQARNLSAVFRLWFDAKREAPEPAEP
ncbi:response regulator transcription factor [Brevundimonas sp.]|uniref:response regulator transcription factor n=1 Tax=Brevundimonas sp. TaxID=1871086 RepID=UPI0039188362